MGAIEELFPNIYEARDIEITPDLIKRIHRIIGANLIQNPGKYRTEWAGPANENWIYLDPKLIDSSLNRLCRDIQSKLAGQGSNNVETRVKIAAMFMTQFLHIHPFNNGNGRVARLVVSLLLSIVSIVPVALYACSESRETYLNCIRQSRQTKPFNHSALARLILESIVDVHRIVCSSLGLADENDSYENIFQNL